MKTLTVTLKQHTPLIHFQHDQYGATLRASEVKPKLDRFLLRILGGDKGYEEGFKIAKEKGWLVEKKGKHPHPALDYKMRIEAINLNKGRMEGYLGYNQDRYGNNRPIPVPMFFGNMKKQDQKTPFIEKGFSLCDQLELSFSYIKEDLRNHILMNLSSFLMQTNFGTRQSKGFGSFSWDEENKKDVLKEFKIKTENGIVSYPYFTSSGDEYTLFQEMDWFYKAIRSGINDCFGQNRLYMKSLMFAYAKKKGEQWEKKTIKSVFYDIILEDDLDAESVNEYEKYRHPKNNDILTYTSKNEGEFIFKDCLGLSTTETWKKPTFQDHKLAYNGTFVLNKSTKKNAKKSSIQRMKSPILLKPIKGKDGKYKIYIMYSPIPEGFLGEKMYIGVEGNWLPLTIYPNFSIKDYFDFLFKKDHKDRKSVV